MFSHGGAGLACPLGSVPLPDENRTPGDGATGISGSDHFRNLGGEPDDRSEICRLAVPGDDGTGARLRPLLARLARRMAEPDAGADDENPEIPAGYTYLGQLLAHDMVMSGTSLAAIDARPAALRDHRAARLVLETVYGGGPEASPNAYALETFADEARMRLRLGRAAPADLGSPESWPLRDVARASPGFTNDLPYIGREPRMRTALIADPRNDDNLLVSQLLVLFHIAHNVTCNLLIERNGALPAGDPGRLDGRDRARVFRAARKLMTRMWRRIVCDDYLRRVLHPAIHAAYDIGDGGAAPWTPRFDLPDDPRMPVEFSHGAFRMGHAMVRDRYILNRFDGEEALFETDLADLLNLTSDGTKPDFPLMASWLVQWSHFFDFPPDATGAGGRPLPRPQPSMRIRPAIAAAMTPSNQRGDGYGRGLPYRDLVSAVSIGTRSAPSLARQVGQVFGEPAAAAPAVAQDGRGLAGPMAAWLKAGDVEFSDDEATAIAADPPLPFFVLFEAQHEAKGAHLGFVGSAIVAETVAGALTASRPLLEGDPLTARWEEETGLGEIATVQDLCLFLVAHAGFAAGLGHDVAPII